MNVLCTSAGRRVALVRAFQAAVGPYGGRVIAADLSRASSASHVADTGVTVPRVTDPSYVERVVALCEEHHIGLVVPLIDPELPVLAAARDRLAAVGAVLVASGPETAAVSDSKRVATQFFERAGLGTARLVEPDAVRRGEVPLPVFLKPEDGSSSIGSRSIPSLSELEYWLPRTRRPLLFEELTGPEYTVDVYVGLDGQPRCAVPRRRLEVRAGEVSKGITEAHPAVMRDALRAAAALPDARGVLTFQCRVDTGGTPRFFELNARFGGGAPLSIAAGADFPRWLVEERLGRRPQIAEPAFRHGVLMLRYDDAVFLEDGHALLAP